MKRLSNRGAALIAAVLLILTLASVKVQSAHAAGCTNEAIRSAQGTAALALPDCRAYELVTPGGQPFIAIGGGLNGPLASTTGNGLFYDTRYPAQAAVKSGEPYVATRGSSGWSVESVAPQSTSGSSILFNCEQGFNLNPDFSKSILSDGWNSELEGSPGQCQESEEVLVPGAPRGYGNIYLREGGPGTPYRLVNLTPPGEAPGNALVRAYTTDFNHILFEDDARLTADAPMPPEKGPLEDVLYEWSAGIVHLVSVLPDGEAVPGKPADQEDGANFFSLASINNALSEDGEEVFFYADGNLYLRKHALQPPTASGVCSPTERTNACTVQVDQKHGGVGASGDGKILVASADGSRVIFSDWNQLTADSKASPPTNNRAGQPDLYELNVQTGFLRDLTHTEAFERPNVLGVSGFSENGSVLYFSAAGVLNGTGPNAEGKSPQPGGPNLYLLDGDELRFVASGATGESSAGGGGGFLATAISPDGRYFAFTSTASLTGFDNTLQNCTGANCKASEIFRYDAQAERLECISCGTSQPTSNTTLLGPNRFSDKSSATPVAFSRQVLNDGQVFFTTANALVPQDSNGALDVYEFEEGQPHLISSGTAAGESVFFDADPSGSNVFFATPQDILSSDTNHGLSVYDARVEGGFSEPPPVPACEGEGCRGAPATAVASPATPASAGFIGREEGPKHPRQASCKRGHVKRQGKCVKKKPQKTNHKQKNHKRTKHASSKRRNAK